MPATRFAIDSAPWASAKVPRAGDPRRQRTHGIVLSFTEGRGHPRRSLRDGAGAAARAPRGFLLFQLPAAALPPPGSPARRVFGSRLLNNPRFQIRGKIPARVDYAMNLPSARRSLSAIR